MSYGRFFVIRLAWSLIGFLVACALVFLAFRVLQRPHLPPTGIPGPAQARYQKQFYEVYGGRSDEPVYRRFGEFFGDFLDDGSIDRPRPATRNREPRAVVLDALPATAALVLPGLAFALLVAFAYGLTWARAGAGARRLWRWPVYIAFGALPVALALWLSLELGVRLHWFPIAGYCDAFNPQTKCGGVVDWADHLVLPWITFGLFFAAVYARILRYLVRRVLDADEDQKPRLERSTGLVMARTIGLDLGPAIGLAVSSRPASRFPESVACSS